MDAVKLNNPALSFTTTKNSAVATCDDSTVQPIYKAVADHLCCDLNGESVILSLETGKYYGLNEVGSRIWELLQTATTAAQIENLILQEYAVDEATCKAEVNSFLQNMLSENLIETNVGANR